MNLLDAAFVSGLKPRMVEQEIAVPANDRQQIIEVVSHSSGKSADRFHLVGLTKPLLELPVFAFGLLKRGAHAVEC